MKTHTAKIKDLKRSWYLLDADNKPLGRIATKAATLLRGKHKRDFTPNFDMGDFVVLINSAKAKLTGKKEEQKIYYRHSGYPGRIKKEQYSDLIIRKPTEPLRKAVLGMIPNNSLKREQTKRLKIYADEKHNHSQKLIKIEL